MTASVQDLQHSLQRLEGRPYPAYRDLQGRYDFEDFQLCIDHVQGDPFAAPSRLRVMVPASRAGFPEATRATPIRRTALRDFLARQFARRCADSRERLGSGKSGLLAMDEPGQEILERSSIMIRDDQVEARLVAGLPARGRRILGREAARLLCHILPEIVRQTLFFPALDHASLRRHLDTAEDAQALRQGLAERGLVAFVADGSCLPRRSGVDDRPLAGEVMKVFQSPPSLRHTLGLPHAGTVTGLGIPRGITLIVGGGFHGKSTLLHALERGIYNHVPGDGRERVVTDPAAVKIRAEDGRRVEGLDLSPFINHLPGNTEADNFCTDNASGSTSQAANLLEALEVGARVLLLDEDTCATNLLIRDARMQALVEKSGEPITPFLDRVPQLNQRGISTILVLGGCGDYFDVADTVIRMDAFEPRDVTAEAKAIARRHPTGRTTELETDWPPAGRPRIPLAASLDPSQGHREIRITARALRAVQFGREEIDVSLVAQLVDEGQLRAVGHALELVRRQWTAQPDQDFKTGLDQLMARLAQEGLDILDDRARGDYVEFRIFELAAALNRLRSLKVRNR